MSNICDDDFPIWGCREGMPEVLRSKDFQDLSGRQFELRELFVLVMVSDLQFQDLCQKKHRIREVAGADPGRCFGCEFQGNLLQADLT
jgi:hypothetical protein